MKLVVIGGGNMGLTYAKGIHQAGLLTEKISMFRCFFKAQSSKEFSLF